MPHGETAVITGASAGLGREFARQLAADGTRVVLVARREGRLRELADEIAAGGAAEPVVLPLDLVEPGAVARLEQALAGERIDVDLLVNNAGFGARGRFGDVDGARQLEMIDLNVRALTDLCRTFLPRQMARGRGGILNVASTAAFQPGPGMAVYYATKAFVLSLSQALHEEARGSGVTVSCLCPGPTETEFREVAGLPGSRLARVPAMEAAPVVRAGIRGYRRGRAVVVPGASNRLGTLAARLAPGSVVRRAVAWLQL